MILNLSNLNIVNYYQSLIDNKINNEQYIPVAINFFIQKNILQLEKYYNEIIHTRNIIIEHYQEMDEEGNQIIPPDKIALANKEIDELLAIVQKVDITLIPLKTFIDLNVQLSTGQLSSLIFMIQEDTDIFTPLISYGKEEEQSILIDADKI